MFAFPSKESPTSLSSVSQKLQFPAKPKPQSPYGLHRFSYTNEHNVAQTALVRTPSPNKDFRKVSSQHNVLESPAKSPNNKPQTRPRAMSAGSVRSAKTVNTQNTTETAQTNNSLNTTNSRLSTGISVANSVSEGAVNRDLGKWFQTSTKDPKIAFMQSSLISVLKTTSRSSTPTRSLASNSSFLSVNNKSSASVLSTGERRLPLSTPHASSAWREHYQERGKERVEEFMQVDHLDYLGLAELAATSISKNVDGDDKSSTEDNNYEENGQLTLDQQRSLKDAQDGLMSLQAMGDAVLGASRVQTNTNSSAGGGGGGGSLSPQSLLGLGTDHAELQAQELLKRRQRRILQLVKDFRSNNTVKLDSILSSQENETGTMRRHQLIVAAKQAIEEAARAYNEHTADAAAQLAEYESELSQQNTYYFDLQQQLLESEAQLATAGEEHRQLLTVMQKAFKQAEDRVGKATVAPLVSRYPQSWFNPNQPQQGGNYLHTDETDADSVFMHLNQQQHHHHSNNRRRNSFSSNASMSVSELSTHTRHTHNNNHYSSAYNNRNHYPDQGAQTLSSSKHANQMPSAQLFSEPWVYNVNTAVVASPTSSAGHRMYGPSFVERRAASPSPLPRTTSHISSNYNNINSSDSVVSRSTSASRSRSATINRRNSNDDASASGCSGSRGRSRYATINGPVSVSPRSTTNSRLRSVSAERRNRSATNTDNYGSGYGGVTNEDHYPILSSDNESASIGRAISKLESSRNELHANSPKYHNNHSTGNRSNSHSCPISMLKQEADSGDAAYSNNSIYAASALNRERAVENNFVPNGRRGSYDTVRSTDSTVSHLSVSTVSSHKNRPSNHSHPANNTRDNANTYPPERSLLGLQRSPPLSAASHRQRNHHYNNSPSNRDVNTRRYSEVTDSTDANYSSIRHHDYALEDIHTDPTRPPVYATESYASTTNSRSVPPVQGDTQFYSIHYLDAESAGRDATSSVIIEGKNNRRVGDCRVKSPKVSNADDGHISSSSSSGNDRDVPLSRKTNNSAFHAYSGNKATNHTGTQENSNYKDSDSFMEMKALDYINHYYRGDAGNSSQVAQKRSTKTNPQQAPTPWTLSKYNSAPNTSTSASNNNISRNANSHSNNTGKRNKTPQLAVYRGRGASGDMTIESAQTALSNTGGYEVRRASIPKVPIPMVEVVQQVKEPVYHNAAQADMAGYIESMRRRKV